MADVQKFEKQRVVAIRTRDAVNLGDGGERTVLALDAAWAIQGKVGLEFEHTGGMSVLVKWNSRDSKKGPMRNRALVSCSQITFEPSPA